MEMTEFLYRRGPSRHASCDRVSSRRAKMEKFSKHFQSFEITVDSGGSTESRGYHSSDSTELRHFDAFHFAYENVSLMAFAASCLLAALLSYFLFIDFVRPTIWAVICGIALYPLKREMTLMVKNWLDAISETQSPLVFGLVCLPLQLLDVIGEQMLEAVLSHKKAVGVISLSVPTTAMAIRLKIVPKLLVLSARVLWRIDQILILSSSHWVPVAFVLYQLYFVVRSFTWSSSVDVADSRPICYGFWLSLFAYVCSYFGPARTFVFSALSCLALVHFLLPAKGEEVQSEADKTESVGSGMDSESSVYLKYLILTCFFVYLSTHLWLLALLSIPLLYGVIKRSGYVQQAFASVKTALMPEGQKYFLLCYRRDFVPPWIEDLAGFLLKLDRKLIYMMKCSMDTVGSIAAMLVLAAVVIFIILFVSFQLYYEGIYMANLFTEVANDAFEENPLVRRWISEIFNISSIEDGVDKVFSKIYSSTQDCIAAKIDNAVEDKEKSELLQAQIFGLLDTFITHWRNDSDNLANKYRPNGTATPQALLAKFFPHRSDDTDKTEMSSTAALTTFLESSWTLVLRNFELIGTGLTEVLLVFFERGSSLADFLLDTVVFVTVLFNLLCSSDTKFKPLEMLQYCAHTKENADSIASEIEGTISGVFVASLKMAIFYGLFTWLTHVLFAVNLIFIPSVLAALFAAVPFFGPYLTTLPAILELWAVRGEPALAVLLLLLHIAPGYIIDDAIYSEIKTTNPFITGMAIAGGMLWFGLEGVVFGPILLCFILVIATVYTSLRGEQSGAEGSRTPA